MTIKELIEDLQLYASQSNCGMESSVMIGNSDGDPCDFIESTELEQPSVPRMDFVLINRN